MQLQRQRGFTLIEVVVAFAIFALSLGALYESFGGAVRRNAQAHEREQGLLAAQSLLSQLRTTPAPWKMQDSGTLEGGWAWRMEVAPFDAASDERSAWHAFAVTIHLSDDTTGTKEVVVRSVELARVSP
jgi:general secretion pathway protein I